MYTSDRHPSLHYTYNFTLLLPHPRRHLYMISYFSLVLSHDAYKIRTNVTCPRAFGHTVCLSFRPSTPLDVTILDTHAHSHIQRAQNILRFYTDRRFLFKRLHIHTDKHEISAHDDTPIRAGAQNIAGSRSDEPILFTHPLGRTQHFFLYSKILESRNHQSTPARLVM